MPSEEKVVRILGESLIKSFACGAVELVLPAPCLKGFALESILLISLRRDGTTLQVRLPLSHATDDLGPEKTCPSLRLRCRVFSEPNVVLLPTAEHLAATLGADLRGSVG